MSEVGYAEVPIRGSTPTKWKEICINTGAAQSTLEDIKLPERAGGYVYQDSRSNFNTRNRFIYWRTNHNILELIEDSLDVNLLGNRLRFRFQHTPLLEGLSVHETHNNVVILVATVACVHRLTFPHPRKLKQEYGSRQKSSVSIPSVFFDASAGMFRDFHVLNHVGTGTSLPHNSCSWLGPNGEAVFVLGSSSSSTLTVVSVEPLEEGGRVSTMELRRNLGMSRFWTGIIPSAIRGSDQDESSLSLVCHQTNDDLYIFSLGRDLKIRMWSYRKQECLLMSSVLDYCDDTLSGAAWNTTGRQPCMYKAVDSSGENLYLGVYISFPEQNQFCVFQPLSVSSCFRLSHIATLFASENDLVDFCISSTHLWTLWVNQNSEPVVCMKSYDSIGGSDFESKDWISVHLQSIIPQDKVTSPGNLDARELYLEKIFGRRAFSSLTISKALSIYCRRNEGSILSDHTLGSLRDEVVNAIEGEIHARANEVELNAVDYVQLSDDCWDKFYSYCVQYHEVGMKPLGLFVDPRSGLAALIRRDQLSLFRPCEKLETYIYSEDFHIPASEYSQTLGIKVLIECIGIVNDNLTLEMAKIFSEGLYHQVCLETLASELVSKFSSTEGFYLKLQNQLQTVPDLMSALKSLLQSLEIIPPEEISCIDESTFPGSSMWNYLFSSNIGLGLTATCLHQLAAFKYTFCQNLLLLEYLLLQLGERASLFMHEKMGFVHSEIIPQTTRLVQAFYVLLWITETECSSLNIERRINQLSISDSSEKGLPSTDHQTSSLAELFLREGGGECVLNALIKTYSPKEGLLWPSLLPVYLQISSQLLWPMTFCYTFPKTLLECSQFMQLQEYVRLLYKWCDYNKGTCQYLLAQSLFYCKEVHKACDIFCNISEIAPIEPYLTKLLLDQHKHVSTALYFLNIIHMYEIYNIPDCIITLSKAALGKVANDENIPTFWSLIFKHQLELGHLDEAYCAMTQIKDLEMRKDCLRQFVVVLCERRQLGTLVKFPFMDLRDDVVSILESRARATDLASHNYYDLLYAFYEHTDKYRRAASIMYEYSVRLSQEVPGIESLQKQILCYQAAINCLLLVNPNYAWIVKPVSYERPDNEARHAGRSPKRDNAGDEVKSSQRSVEVIEIEDIRKELDLVDAWLKLAQHNEKVSCPLSPSETVTLLIAAGFFDIAAKISQIFELKLDPVFEGLAHASIKAGIGDFKADDRTTDPQWVVENPQSILDGGGLNRVSVLLMHYLKEYEKPGCTAYHRCVATTFISNGYPLPSWFSSLYKLKDPAELLRLYIFSHRLEEATTLAVEYINAVLGQGKEYFGLKHALHSTNPAVYLPHTVFDRLLITLQSSDSAKGRDLYIKLRSKLEEYFITLEQVTRLM